MEALTGYQSDDEAVAPAAAFGTPALAAALASSAPHTLPTAERPSAQELRAIAAETIAPDDKPLPPGQMRPSARAETPEERAARKDARKAAKAVAKAAASAAAAAAAAAPPKAKLVLPSAEALLSGLSATAMGAGPAQSGNEADSEGGSPAASSGPAKKKSYNALPAPASLIAETKMSDEEAWRMKPIQMDQSKKRRFVDMPNVAAPVSSASSVAAPAAASASSSATAARPAASGSTSAHRMFAPPQVARKQANIATEDVGNWSVAKRRSTGKPAASDAAAAADSASVAQ